MGEAGWVVEGWVEKAREEVGLVAAAREEAGSGAVGWVVEGVVVAVTEERARAEGD